MLAPVYALICSQAEGGEQPLGADDSCVCHACYKQAARNVGNENFKPRWRESTSTKGRCGVDGCDKHAYRRTQMASPVAVVGKDVATSHPATPLCKAHYIQIQNTIHAPRPCSSCGAKPKWGEQHTRHCPDAQLVNSYLTNICNETSALTTSSTICSNCYKLFTDVVSELKQSEVVFEQARPTSSTSLWMEGVLARLSSAADSILAGSAYSEANGDDLTELSFCNSAKLVAVALSRHEAMLLPVVYREFCDMVMSGGEAVKRYHPCGGMLLESIITLATALCLSASTVDLAL